MSFLKVMISPYYNGGAWVDEGTGLTFDPAKHQGSVISIPRSMDVSGILKSLRLNHLLPYDGVSAEEAQSITGNPDITIERPKVVQTKFKHNVVEIVFDRPVFPIPGKKVSIPTPQGELVLDVTEAYMENDVVASFVAHAKGDVTLDDSAFIDGNSLFTEAYPKQAPTAPVKEEPKEEAPEEDVEAEEPAEEKVEVEAKSTKRKRTARKKAEDTE